MRARESPIIFQWRSKVSWKSLLRKPRSHHFVPKVYQLHNYCLNVHYFSISTFSILQCICLHQTLQNLSFLSLAAPRAASWKPLPNTPLTMTRIVTMIAFWCGSSIHWTVWPEQTSLTKEGLAMNIFFTPGHLAHTSSYKASSMGNLELLHSGPKSMRHWHGHAPLHHLIRKETSLTLASGGGTGCRLSSSCLWGSAFHRIML